MMRVTWELKGAAEGCERLALEKEGGEIRRLIDPLLPSQKEVEEHLVRGHVPYRNWCGVCVRARGRERDHTKDKGGDRQVPGYHFAHCFPGDEMGFKWTILVGRERMSKSWFARADPQKGASGRFSADKCLEFVQENGDEDNRVLIKTDQEPSIQYLVKDIIDLKKEGKQ